MSEEMFLVKLKYFLGEERGQFLVNGMKELSKLTNLLTKTQQYTIISIERLGRIDSYSDLIQDLIEDQRPEDLDYALKARKERTHGDTKQRH